MDKPTLPTPVVAIVRICLRRVSVSWRGHDPADHRCRIHCITSDPVPEPTMISTRSPMITATVIAFVRTPSTAPLTGRV